MNDNQQNVEIAIQDILAQFRAGDPESALKAAGQARESYPDYADLYHVTSNILLAGGAHQPALEMMEHATQKPDTNPKYLLELADMYIAAGREKDAEENYQTYLETNSPPIPGLMAMATLFENQGNFDAAQDTLNKAVEAAGDDAESKMVRLNELGTRLRRMGKPEQAIDAFRRALELEQNQPELHFNIANAQMDACAHDEAIKHYGLSMDINHDHPTTHLHLGFAYLLKGNFKRGWREMEWRWKIPVFAQTALESPRWKGEQIDGTILMLSEQGLGDSVHFVRYAAQVAERCNRVVVYCPASLARLMKSTPGVDAVTTWDEPIPEHVAYVPMMSLPYVFKTELNTIPQNVPYLSAQAEDIAMWRDKLSALPGPKIGLVWSGNPKNELERKRAIPTACVMEMVKACKASFVCMTKDRPADIDTWPDNLYHFGDAFADVADAAAAVESLDLVLSIDTLMTHLAGALNKELWILLAPAADWRYLLDREDSPWYPSARLIRRTRDEDWSAFMLRVAGDLKTRFDDV